jgi:hypothetical protein
VDAQIASERFAFRVPQFRVQDRQQVADDSIVTDRRPAMAKISPS